VEKKLGLSSKIRLVGYKGDRRREVSERVNEWGGFTNEVGASGPPCTEVSLSIGEDEEAGAIRDRESPIT